MNEQYSIISNLSYNPETRDNPNSDISYAGAANKQYESFNDVRNNPALPAPFRTQLVSEGGFANLYYDKKTNPYQAVYCTEIERGFYYNKPDESTTPTSNFGTAEKRRMLEYVLSHGQKIMNPQDDEVVKMQIATQLAVWMIAEDIYSTASYNSAAIDSILGGPLNTYGSSFTPTQEVGDMARRLLDNARADLSNSTTSMALYPSFASEQQLNAPSYNMTANAGSYQVVLDDINNVLGSDWQNYIRVDDANGMNISVLGNKMIITGDPAGCKTIALAGKVTGSEVHYLSTDKLPSVPPYEPFQKMARLVRIIDNDYSVKLYFNVCVQAAPSTSVNLIASKTAVGAALPEGGFEFGVFESDGTLLTQASSDADGNIVFPAITYTQTGTFNYTIKEMSFNGGGWTTDGRAYSVTADVTDDGSGNLKATVSYPNGQPEFINEYTGNPPQPEVCAVIEAKKIACGTCLCNNRFRFGLFNPDGTLFSSALNDSCGNVVFPKICYSSVGTYRFTMCELTQSNHCWTTDTRKYNVVIVVAIDAAGEMTAKVSYPDCNPTFVNCYCPPCKCCSSCDV